MGAWGGIVCLRQSCVLPWSCISEVGWILVTGFVLVYIREIIPLGSCFNTLHPNLIFLICCNCCLHFISLVQFSSTVLVLPHFCYIFVLFQKQNKPPFSFDVFSPFSLIYSSRNWLSLAERWPKLPVELCLYSLGNAKPALAREVQHLRSFSGLTAAFVSHYIWSKYLSASLEEKTTPNNYLWKVESYPNWEKTQKTTVSEKGWENAF